MWIDTSLTDFVSVRDGKESRTCAASKQKHKSSSGATNVSRLREMPSRLLNSIKEPSTLLGFIVWAMFMMFVGLVLVVASMSPTWLLILMAICLLPYIFGACKENGETEV